MKILGRYLRAFTALVLATCLACPPAAALVTLNDGHDRIHVTGSMGVTHDSNVFAANGGKGDFMYTSGFTADYQRRAGWIGVNASVGVSASKFASLTDQDYSDPSFNLELTKQTGRTTGSINLSAARETRADAAVNARSSSWNINYGAAYHYHITGTWDLSGSLGFSQRKYQDETTYSNLDTFSSSFDLIKLLSSERDLMLGYRYRYNDTSRHTSSDDHNFSAGLHGKVIGAVNGAVRVGYQFRVPHGRRAAGTTNKDYQSWSASGNASYAINKKINLSGSISKDFSTTATDASVDTLSTSLDGQYALSSRIGFNVSTGLGRTSFLDNLGPPREDTYLTGGAGASYSFSEHLKLSLNYSWFKNWSSLSFADFVRSSWSFSASSHW
jgi:hypothetical protein